MTEKSYAFIVNNIVTNVAVFDNPSQELLDSFARENNLDLIIEADENTAIGGVYNGIEFFPPSPFPSWTWDSADKIWVAPTPKPLEGLWNWSEDDLTWIILDRSEPQR